MIGPLASEYSTSVQKGWNRILANTATEVPIGPNVGLKLEIVGLIEEVTMKCVGLCAVPPGVATVMTPVVALMVKPAGRLSTTVIVPLVANVPELLAVKV